MNNYSVRTSEKPALGGIGAGITGRTTACAGDDPAETAGGAGARGGGGAGWPGGWKTNQRHY